MATTKKKAAGSAATICVRQIGSTIGQNDRIRATLTGLGLGRIGQTKTLKDSPSVRGLIAKVKHLVAVDSAA
jgi:large subunit ribosomal protein L30